MSEGPRWESDGGGRAHRCVQMHLRLSCMLSIIKTSLDVAAFGEVFALSPHPFLSPLLSELQEAE